MRTTSAASPRRLHWQAAFTTKPYKAQTSSLVVWQHVFVSDTPMTNWCGPSLLLTRVVKKNPSGQNVVRPLTGNAAHHQNVSLPRSLDETGELRSTKHK
jgi:hypothetical protein